MLGLDLIVMIAIWIVIGLLIGVLAGTIWKGVRPLGEVWDYVISIACAVVTGLLDWYVLPLIGIEGAMRFAAAILEPALVSIFALWLVRKLKKS
ncbi:MAG TPA: hypothetical protein G4O08_04310 [Anaerolineae bacterium]|nr:hypothetical protein [Anaerolineae bacterium]